MKKQFRLRQLVLILVLVLIASMTSFAVGKYVFKTSFSRTVTFTAELADSFLLRERTAVRQDNGEYILEEPFIENNAGSPQQYILLPGLDVPKDPHVVITGKTPIPANLYIEVVDRTDNPAISFEMEDHWITTGLKAPKHGGTMYAYSTNGYVPAEVKTDLTIYILKDNRIYVSQTLNHTGTNELLTIYAYLEEVQE